MTGLNQKIILIADNIRSALNIGSLFRTADAVGVGEIILCGTTPTPDHPKVAKTALGAELRISWQHAAHTWRTIEDLKSQGVRIVALEQSKHSITYTNYKPSFPLALVIGNEVSGISPAILRRCDDIIEIPMQGIKESLNVTVAAGIALYKLNEYRI